MLIINTTYHVSNSVEDRWKKWVKTEYVPSVIKSSILINPRFHRVYVENEEDSNTYALQFEVANLDKMEYWLEHYGKGHNAVTSDLFHEDVLGFTTVMELIDLD